MKLAEQIFHHKSTMVIHFCDHFRSSKIGLFVSYEYLNHYNEYRTSDSNTDMGFGGDSLRGGFDRKIESFLVDQFRFSDGYPTLTVRPTSTGHCWSNAVSSSGRHINLDLVSSHRFFCFDH